MTDKTWKLLLERLEVWYEAAIKGIPNFVLALVIVVTFALIAKLVKNMVGRFIPRFTSSRAVQQLMQTSAYCVVLLLGVFIALGVLNLDKTVTSLLAGAGVLGLALGFAFQEIATNFVSGVLIAFEEPYRIGDIVQVDNFFGEITNIKLRTTSITTFQGVEVMIPNKDMFTKPLSNYTTTAQRRIDLVVGVSYAEDLRKVEQVTKEALEDIEGRIFSMPIEVFFSGFGDSSINLQARIWVEYPANQNYLRSQHQAVINIKEAYDKNGITIPFPIRTLDFGIKGGEKLSKPLSQVFGEKVDAET